MGIYKLPNSPTKQKHTFQAEVTQKDVNRVLNCKVIDILLKMKTKIFGHLVVTLLGHLCECEESWLPLKLTKRQLIKSKPESDATFIFCYLLIITCIKCVFSIQTFIRLAISKARAPEIALLWQAASCSSLSHQKHAELKKAYGNDYVLYSLTGESK